MILTVRIPAWEMEDDRRVLRVGDTVSSWLTFEEAGETSPLGDGVQVILGIARRLPSWPGATWGRHPVQVDIGGTALYWDAPDVVEGPIQAAGTICTNNVDAPDGFPTATGVLRRARMEWSDVVMGTDGSWRAGSAVPRYEEVEATYFPPRRVEPLDPDVEADVLRRARKAYDHEVSSGRLTRGESFTIGVFAQTPPAPVPPGTTKTQWTGVLIELEIADPGVG